MWETEGMPYTPRPEERPFLERTQVQTKNDTELGTECARWLATGDGNDYGRKCADEQRDGRGAISASKRQRFDSRGLIALSKSVHIENGARQAVFDRIYGINRMTIPPRPIFDL
jgi:hypothetical protein